MPIQKEQEEEKLIEYQQTQQQQKTTTEIYYPVTDGLQSPHTISAYRLTFNHFLDQTVHTHDLQVMLDYSPRIIESMIIEHVKHLRDVEKLSHKSIQVHCAAIFHFFDMNDVILNRRKIKRFLPPDESSPSDRAYSHEEIVKILSKCDERSRVIILLMVSTGMRIGALPGLQIGDIASVRIDNSNSKLYKMWVYARSRKDRYYTFCTPECAAAIDSYLDYRKRFGEELKDKTPLIREQFNIDNPFTIQSAKLRSERTIIYAVEQVLKRSGVNKTGEVMRSYGFRKFYVSQMIKVNVNYNAREYLVGHRQSRGLDQSYDRTSEEDRLTEYAKAIDLLTISPEHRLQKKVKQLEVEQSVNAEEFKRLKAEIDEIRKVIEMPLKDLQNYKPRVDY
jgi:integrase